MSQLVILNLGRGSLQSGFPVVTVSIYTQNQFEPQQCISHLTGSLPAAPQLLTLYRRWQSLYESLYRMRVISIRQEMNPLETEEEDGLEIDESDVTHVSEVDFANLAGELQHSLNNWLDTEEFRHLERQLRMQFHPSDEISIVIQTEDSTISQLPWFAWQFLQDYPRAEIAFSALNVKSGTSSPPANRPLRILAILGDATGIDLDHDRALLSDLPQAEVAFLVEPSRQVFNDYLWDEQGWDILFFAGHSTTHPDEMTGRIYLNPEESLTVSQLNYALNRAIAQGLQLAIFNSCDGLGLAQQLMEVNLPQTIVMREPVSDWVAQEFLKYFLTAFAKGHSFFLAAREARERLQGLEGEFPGASWLPAIFQNPTAVPLSWPKAEEETASSLPDSQTAASCPTQLPKISRLLLVSAIMTVLVMGIRWLGLLQPWELSAYDSFMRWRPGETPSNNILLVTIDSEDINYQERQEMSLQGSLADEALAELLDKIAPLEKGASYRPAVIGLDIWRDPPIRDPASKAKVDRWREKGLMVDICQIGNGETQEVPPPPYPPNDNLTNVGFSDIPQDSDSVIRRQLFGMAPGSKCNTNESLSFLLAKRYLATQDIKPQQSKDRFKIGSAIFSRIEPPAGGYQSLDKRGFQVLLNYHDSDKVAPAIPLRKILNGSLNEEKLADLVSNRIVLVGTLDETYQDYHQTPYSLSALDKRAGVKIQAHAAASIISAALGERPTLWWLPQWGDFLLVWGWAFAGGTIVFMGHNRFVTRPRLIVAVAGITLLVLLGGYWLVFWQRGGWLPLIPSLLGAGFTALVIKINHKLAILKKILN